MDQTSRWGKVRRSVQSAPTAPSSASRASTPGSRERLQREAAQERATRGLLVLSATCARACVTRANIEYIWTTGGGV